MAIPRLATKNPSNDGRSRHVNSHEVLPHSRSRVAATSASFGLSECYWFQFAPTIRVCPRGDRFFVLTENHRSIDPRTESTLRRCRRHSVRCERGNRSNQFPVVHTGLALIRLPIAVPMDTILRGQSQWQSQHPAQRGRRPFDPRKQSSWAQTVSTNLTLFLSRFRHRGIRQKSLASAIGKGDF